MASNAPGGRKEFGQDLENEFFRREDQKLIERMRALADQRSAREALARATGIDDPAVLDELMRLEIRPEMVAALSVLPLVEVAWADGKLDLEERNAVLAHAQEDGIAPGSAERVLLEAWLAQRPERRLFDAWTRLVRGLTAKLDAAEAARFRTRLLDRARGVARASGGVLGLGSKVSKDESAALARLEAAFPAPR